MTRPVLPAWLFSLSALVGLCLPNMGFSQTFKPVHALDPMVCEQLGCTPEAVERIDRSLMNQEFNRDLFSLAWATATTCVDGDPFGAECEESVGLTSDSQWHRLIWSEASQFVRSYGTRGAPSDGPGHFHMPMGVDLTHRSGGHQVAFVADAMNERIVVLDLYTGFIPEVRWLGTIDGAASGQTFVQPTDVAWDHAGTWARSDDRIFVADSRNSRIVVYAVDVDVGNESFTATFLDEFGGYGAGSSQLMFPQGITVMSSGQGSSLKTNVYVGDSGNARVKRWRYDGANPTPIYGGTSNVIAGASLSGISVDPFGDIFVADRRQGLVSKLSGSTLQVLDAIGGTPYWSQGSIDNPSDVDVYMRLQASGSAMSVGPIALAGITERWSDTTGAQVHRLGTKATNLAHFGSCGGSLNFTLTGATDRYRVIVTGSGGTRVFPLQYNPPQGYYPSGNYSQQWDGANTQGEPMPSGTYTLKVYTETPYDYDNNAGHTSQINFNYNCNFYVSASVPWNVTQKAWYPLNGSATHSATDWEWQARWDSVSWNFWSSDQNTGWVAYAGEYVMDWKLTAESTQGGGTNFDIETTYVCTTSNCGGGQPPMDVVAGDIGDAQFTSGQSTPVAIASGSGLRSVSADALHFGSGIWVGREYDGTAYVDRYYSLLGQHDVNLGEEEWPNLLEADSVDWTTSEQADALSHRISSRRMLWKDGISVYAIAGEVDAQKGGSSPISFALAADPDLGEPHDDELGFDEGRELVWVGDVDSTFVGYVVLDAPRGARVAVVQYGLGLGDEPTRRSQARQELTKESSWAQGVKGDVRFLLTVDRVNVDEQGRFDVNLAVLRANSLMELTGLVDELRRSTGAVLASMAPPELSGDPEPRGLVPDEFALGQRLPGLQSVVRTGNLVRREAPIAHSVIGGQPSQGGASSAAVAQAIRVSGVTALNFDVPEASRVIIRIYDRSGAMVRTLLDEDVDAGAYAYGWDGLADTGQRMAPGVYYAVMEAERFSDRSKLILVR